MSEEAFYFYFSQGVTVCLLLLSEYLGSTDRHESNSIFKLICCCICITSKKQARLFIEDQNVEPVVVIVEGDKV